MTGVHATVRHGRARPAALPVRFAPRPSTRRVAVALAVWAAWYAAYRFYYAFGGHLGMIGHPSPAQRFRRDNFVIAERESAQMDFANPRSGSRARLRRASEGRV